MNCYNFSCQTFSRLCIFLSANNANQTPFPKGAMPGQPSSQPQPIFLGKNNKYVHLGRGKKMKIVILLENPNDLKINTGKIQLPNVNLAVKGKHHKNAVTFQVFWKQTHFSDLGHHTKPPPTEGMNLEGLCSTFLLFLNNLFSLAKIQWLSTHRVEENICNLFIW